MTGDRMVRATELKVMLGCSHPTLYRWVKSPDFPARIKLGPCATGWKLSEVNQWLESRKVQVCS